MYWITSEEHKVMPLTIVRVCVLPSLIAGSSTEEPAWLYIRDCAI
jgi:hypothetical protein